MGGSVSEAAGIKSEKPSSGAWASGALADVLIPEREGANGTGLMPLSFLLAVLNDAKNTRRDYAQSGFCHHALYASKAIHAAG